VEHVTEPLVRRFAVADTDAVVGLWERCGLVRPWNDPRKDIERKLQVQPELFLAAEADEAVIATAMAGYDGHRGWVYYLAVDPGSRHQGIGRLLMREVEHRLLAMGCPKVNLLVRSDNEQALAFYERLGYRPDASAGLGKRLIPDD
jgi:ribosomal protein S18 acetylase RimI-like enzyme